MRLRPSPLLLDGVLATAVAALAATEIVTNAAVEPKAAATLAEAALVVAVAMRRRHPLPAVIIATGGAVAETLAGVPVDAPLAPLLAIVLTLYSLGVRGTRWQSGVGVIVVFASVLLSTKDRGLGNFVFGAVFAGGTLTAGLAMRSRVREVQTLSQEAEARRRETIAEERKRIARELHDIVAHAIALMTVQAGAAEQLVQRDPARAATSARAVQELGRDALVEMKRMLGLLRDDGEAQSSAPQPRLTDLPRLAEQLTDAGLTVELKVDAEQAGIPQGIELSVFRVVQEALTNALKHADATHASITVAREHDLLLVEIADNGHGSQTNGDGHGLDGMRERVSIFGGLLRTSASDGGGFIVHAEFPLETAPDR